MISRHKGFAKFQRKLDGATAFKKEYDLSGLRFCHACTNRTFEMVFSGINSELFDLFVWDSSEQGHNYWSRRTRPIVTLTEDDLDYLKQAQIEFNSR